MLASGNGCGDVRRGWRLAAHGCPPRGWSTSIRGRDVQTDGGDPPRPAATAATTTPTTIAQTAAIAASRSPGTPSPGSGPSEPAPRASASSNAAAAPSTATTNQETTPLGRQQRARRVAALSSPAKRGSGAAPAFQSRLVELDADDGVARTCLGVVLAEKLGRLRRTLRKPGFLKDRRDLGVRGEALPAPLVPVEDRPNPVALIWIPKDMRPLTAVLLSLLSALR